VGSKEELTTTLSPLPFPPSPSPIKYQRVYHLNPTNTAAYDALTFPSLQQRWLTQLQRGEMLGISASVMGEIVGMVIAERLTEQTAELISLLVVPSYRQQGVGTHLVHYLEQELARQGCQRMQAIYQTSDLTNVAMDALLRKLNWQWDLQNETVSTVFKAIS
jgi:ribosomal protein S18 acetylase RimI-like enzyme